jgi:hypothetical protein
MYITRSYTEKSSHNTWREWDGFLRLVTTKNRRKSTVSNNPVLLNLCTATGVQMFRDIKSLCTVSYACNNRLPVLHTYSKCSDSLRRPLCAYHQRVRCSLHCCRLHLSTPNVAVERLTFMLRIREVPGSNLGPCDRQR